jgi:hypothetical protein
MNNATALSPAITTPAMSVNTWTLLDGIWTANGSTLVLRLNYTGGGGNQTRTVQFDNVMAIDLTSAFGAGSEPAIDNIRNLVSIGGDFWDGAQVIAVPEPALLTYIGGKRITECYIKGGETAELYRNGVMFYRK